MKPARMVALALALGGAEALAQTPPQVRAPRLTQFIEATYPPGRLSDPQEAAVLLELTLTAEGTVRHIDVRESAGEDFDAAATAAAQQFVFEPALVNGVPSPIRLRYRYRFHPPAPPPPPPPPPPPVVEAPPPPPPPPPPPVVTRPGRLLPPVAPRSAEEPEMVVTSSRLRRHAVSTEVTADQARRLPGTSGDVLRVVENLPGVARSSVGSGQLVVWGASPQDTRVYLDGVPVPRLYHDGGLRSIVPSEVVDSVELVPGAYGAAYGRGLGGLVSATTRPLDRAGVHGVLDANVYDLSGSVRTSLGNRWYAEVSARRSHLDSLLGAVSGEEVSALFPVPRYLDAQARVAWAISPRERLEITALTSSDRTERLSPSADPSLTSSDDRSLTFHRVYARYRRQSLDGSAVTVTPYVGVDQRDSRARVGQVDTSLSSNTLLVGLRANWRQRLRPWATLEAGLDAEVSSAQLQRSGSIALPAREGDARVFGQPPPDRVGFDTWDTVSVGLAPYVEADFTPFGDRLHITPGLRVDPSARSVSRRTPVEGDTPRLGLFSQNFSLEPRLALLAHLTRALTVKAAAGRYQQSAQTDDLSAAFGTPTLTPSNATHALTGVGVQLTGTLSVEVTGFITLSNGLAVRNPSPTPLRAEALVATGEGRAFGAQVLLRQQLARGFVGWVSYSLIRSERRDGPDGLWRLFDYDQTHVLTTLFTYDLGRGFEAGLRFRVATGYPRTPVTGAWYDASRDRWQPVFGAQNTERLPTFVQLDARLAKTFRIGRTSLDLTLEVQNATNYANAEEVVYSPDFARRGYISSLPLLPVLGARWTF